MSVQQEHSKLTTDRSDLAIAAVSLEPIDAESSFSDRGQVSRVSANQRWGADYEELSHGFQTLQGFLALPSISTASAVSFPP
jgi:hypothetical protein